MDGELGSGIESGEDRRVHGGELELEEEAGSEWEGFRERVQAVVECSFQPEVGLIWLELQTVLLAFRLSRRIPLIIFKFLSSAHL